MTDDLVERLNRWVEDYKDCPGRWHQEMKIAADRIEALETALKFYAKAHPDFLQTADWCWDYGEKRYGYVARNALGNGND